MNEILRDMLKNYGLSEVDGPKSNPHIIEFFREIGYDWVTDDSTTAWCSAVINYFAKKHGYYRSGRLDARSWLKVGEIVLEPQLGDIVVFWRGSISSWTGHVGIYINHNEKYIWVLGGNQSNAINITAYPRERLLGYRRLQKISVKKPLTIKVNLISLIKFIRKVLRWRRQHLIHKDDV
ncbi:MAG: TIGR02594 family protein [Sedimentisphaerales bacterium]|nr:TIGR02594 family protein [Sedimentisphaerales bacterium]